MLGLIILEEAKAELIEAALYYELQKTGLGERFSLAVKKQIDVILRTPKLYQRKKKEYREVLIKPFPFLLVYRIDSTKNRIVVVSVFHTKRNPKHKHGK